MKFLTLLSNAAMVVALAGCSNDQHNNVLAENALTVTGSVIYRDRMALPDNAQITVLLADVSLADAPAKVISTVTFPSKGKQVPFMFTLPYNVEQVNAAQRIAISASISIDDKLLYTTTTMNEVLTNAQPTQMDLVLERVSN
ncbi:hypothetical protein SOASR032_07930 [Pragia fontium]|uniref:Lipoprotein-related protein n=1 Tax=Pragia fontium TaxID=82985 RepID=A0ABQ5LFW9_9GAMM|nr:YbaY family lipoprotein [Pragia fontium]GKX62224.1 hypothetical protein SOASR032_07930 [Pragia fontium]